jgi:hypothetical protein
MYATVELEEYIKNEAMVNVEWSKVFSYKGETLALRKKLFKYAFNMLISNTL